MLQPNIDPRKDAIIVFTKLPLPGITNTRLMSHLTAQECADLQRCFLADIADVIQLVDASVFVNYTPDTGRDAARELTQVKCIFPEGTEYFPQPDTDFGTRMAHAFEVIFDCGFERVITMGSDAFEMDVSYIQESFDALTKHDLTFAPSPDGGYGIVGMRRYIPEIFELSRFSNSSVLEQTLLIAVEIGADIVLTSMVHDIDEFRDITSCLKQANAAQDSQMTRTHAYLQRVYELIAERKS